MTQAICFKNKFGYCKYSDNCRYKHVTLVCEDGQCEIKNCEKRHPKICKYYRDYRRCKFTVGCKYKHENPNDKLDKLQKELEIIRKNYPYNEKENRYKKLEEELKNFERKLDTQQKELENKNAYISQLELRLEDLEKKFKEEKKNREKKFKEMDDVLKNQKQKPLVDSPVTTLYKCEKCIFTSTSKVGLNIHVKRMHTKLYKEKYPKECDFCDDMIESGKEMDLHLKYNHNGRNAAYKCEDCDFIGENGCSLDVHHGKCHNPNFECGLCDYLGKTLDKLEMHLTTCEAYICMDCNFRGRFIADIRTHLRKEHSDANVNITHAKLDRKDDNAVIETEHSRDILE